MQSSFYFYFNIFTIIKNLLIVNNIIVLKKYIKKTDKIIKIQN